MSRLILRMAYIMERNTTRNTMTDAMSTAVQSSRKYDAPMKEAERYIRKASATDSGRPMSRARVP